jgi:hypothetical protein
MKYKRSERDKYFNCYRSNAEVKTLSSEIQKLEVAYHTSSGRGTTTLYDCFGEVFARFDVSVFNKYITMLSKAGSLSIKAIEKNFEYVKLLSKLKNIEELHLKCDATDDNIAALNMLISNNAKHLKVLTLNCTSKSNFFSYELDLTPLKDAEQLRKLYIHCKADVTGLNSLPGSIEELTLETNRHQPVDLSALPHNARYIYIESSVICTDNRYVNTNASTMGILKSNITDDIVERIPDMFPNLTVVSLSNSQRVTNVSALAKNKLYMLFVDGTSIDDANQFADFNDLQYIDISNTLIDSVQPLYKLPKLCFIVTADSAKMFNDEITSAERIQTENLPVILNSEKDKSMIDYIKPPYGNLMNYVTEKLGNDKERLRYIPNYKINNVKGFVTAYKHYFCIELRDLMAYSTCGSVMSKSADNIIISDLCKVKRVTLSFHVIKKFILLPKNARLEYFSAEVERYDLDVLRKNSVILSDLETLDIQCHKDTTENYKTSLSEFDFLLNDKIKNVSISDFNIEPGAKFPEISTLEKISVYSGEQTDISFNLDAMPNLRYIQLIGVRPHFKISHRHENLKFVCVANSHITSIDDIFETDESTELISPVLLNLQSNKLEYLESNIIDFSKVEYLNAGDNWLTDEAVNYGNFKSLHTLITSNNLLSDNKIIEIDAFNEKFE